MKKVKKIKEAGPCGILRPEYVGPCGYYAV